MWIRNEARRVIGGCGRPRYYRPMLAQTSKFVASRLAFGASMFRNILLNLASGVSQQRPCELSYSGFIGTCSENLPHAHSPCSCPTSSLLPLQVGIVETVRRITAQVHVSSCQPSKVHSKITRHHSDPIHPFTRGLWRCALCGPTCTPKASSEQRAWQVPHDTSPSRKLLVSDAWQQQCTGLLVC